MYETSLPSADDRHKVNELVNYQLEAHHFYQNQYDLFLDEADGDIVTE